MVLVLMTPYLPPFPPQSPPLLVFAPPKVSRGFVPPRDIPRLVKFHGEQAVRLRFTRKRTARASGRRRRGQRLCGVCVAVFTRLITSLRINGLVTRVPAIRTALVRSGIVSLRNRAVPACPLAERQLRLPGTQPRARSNGKPA
jgi:hypothetical protein